MTKVLVLTNSINGLYNFRKELIHRLLEENHSVVISAPKDVRTSYFEKVGCKSVITKINRRGMNPIEDFLLFMKYIRLINDEKPDVVLTYTIKPNVYGGLACRILKVPYLANITGLGTSIENDGVKRKLSLILYKIGLRNANRVFFQNLTNKDFFISNNIVHRDVAKLIPGSGVNLEKFTYEPYPKYDETINLLFIGRLMKAKGIEELLTAAKIVKEQYPAVEFNLIGNSEEDYKEIIEDYQSLNIIRYDGPQQNVHNYIKRSHAVINPSHHEGMSNVLLEASATGRPVIASNIPGCKETFECNKTGIGFQVKSVDSLVEAIKKFIDLPHEEREIMGQAGRTKMENEFDRNIVIESYITDIKLIVKE